MSGMRKKIIYMVIFPILTTAGNILCNAHLCYDVAFTDGVPLQYSERKQMGSITYHAAIVGCLSN
jgi:hypothetical protein